MLHTRKADSLVEPILSNQPTVSQPNEIVELSLLLPRWQVLALESVARQSGLTAGQMLRRIVSRIVDVAPVDRLLENDVKF